MRRTETPIPIWIKFCVEVDIPDLVTYTNFGDHRLRGFWVAGGQITPFPIDFYRRPYNTLALPCERVIRDGRRHVRRYQKVLVPYGLTSDQIPLSKAGLALRLDEWAEFMLIIPAINATFPTLAQAKRCTDEESHLSQLGWAACTSCFPF